MFQRFFLGFLSVFRFGAVPIKNNINTDGIASYIDLVEKDFNLSYEKMKNNHEGK